MRLAGEPPQYLLVQFAFPGPHPFVVLLAVLGAILVSLLLGSGVALRALLLSLQKRAQLADTVIAELQSGNLKARFPIERMDEIGEAMSRFNTMADEIERLVEQVRQVEKTRVALLQELAHDLRTPIASIKNLLDTMQHQGESLPAETRKELLDLANNEIDYFERLVEDLLILAQVSEPNYRADRTEVRIDELIEEEADVVSAQYAGSGERIELKKQISDAAIIVIGDGQLLRRMVRNVLENAFSFARGKVYVAVFTEASDGQQRIRVVVEDDVSCPGRGDSKWLTQQDRVPVSKAGPGPSGVFFYFRRTV
jgi:signal transduction histidine kinase